MTLFIKSKTRQPCDESWKRPPAKTEKLQQRMTITTNSVIKTFHGMMPKAFSMSLISSEVSSLKMPLPLPWTWNSLICILVFIRWCDHLPRSKTDKGWNSSRDGHDDCSDLFWTLAASVFVPVHIQVCFNSIFQWLRFKSLQLSCPKNQLSAVYGTVGSVSRNNLKPRHQDPPPPTPCRHRLRWGTEEGDGIVS